ncbi:hypothetical protein [Actinomadura rubrisoli]|uniref:Uncharacterized protein n=1 Tax=Actinomadura rubrisoli TaxID=2530368 RepID=A0A4R5A763_9ACTN|nr:hypothetical protein [Actinomadura rubrisoli]TDD67821.1 hypothetical protein E1298_39005 [Actinomadura rubrisoli]
MKLLDDELRERLVEAIGYGTTIEDAAVAAGISPRTYYRWMRRGETAAQAVVNGEEPEPADEPFWQFWQSAMRAHARGGVINAALLRKIAEGGYAVKTRTRRYRDPATGQVVEETETELAPPNLRAVIFYLERRHPQTWGRNASTFWGLDGGTREQYEAEQAGMGDAGLHELAQRVHESLAYLADNPEVESAPEAGR